MSGFHTNIEEKTLENDNFREVLFTTDKSQLVLMTLQPGEEIGAEVHDDHDQFIRVEEGEGRGMIGEDEYDLVDGSAIVVPAGEEHNVINTSSEKKLKLYTIYTPPEHPEGTVHVDKAEADEYEKEHHG